MWVSAISACFSSLYAARTNVKALTEAAEYYFVRRDYKQALELWKKVLEKSPKDIDAVLRISEIRLHFEGRSAFRDTLIEYLETSLNRLSEIETKKIKQRLRDLQNVFLTDEGQTKYLRALGHIRKKDCEHALPLLNHAQSLEKGNFKVYIEKAKCERILKQGEQFYATLQQAFLSNPYNKRITEDLTETHIYFEKYQKVLELFTKRLGDENSMRQLTGFGIALFQEGKFNQALKILKRILARQAQSPHPVVLYAVGKILAKDVATRGEAISYIQNFIRAVEQKENQIPLSVASLSELHQNPVSWDPYQSDRLMADAKKVLKQLKADSQIEYPVSSAAS